MVKQMCDQQAHTGPIPSAFIQNPMLIMADGSAKYTREDQKHYASLFERINLFSNAFAILEHKNLIKNLSDDGLVSNENSISSSSDESIDHEQKKLLRMSTQEFLTTREIIKQQKYEQTLRIVLDLIESLINQKILEYSISFMLWRYRQYDYMMLKGTNVDAKLGDLNHRQQEIRLRLPRCRQYLQEQQDKLFGETEQVFIDRTSSDDFALNKRETEFKSNGSSPAKLGRRGTKVAKLSKRASIFLRQKSSHIEE